MKYFLCFLLFIVNVLLSQTVTPTFKPITQAKNIDGQNLLIDKRPTPAFFDWDGDGLEDLLVGTLYGNVKFYKNNGTVGNPRFKDFEILMAGSDTLQVTNAG